MEGKETTPKVFTYPIAFNLIPHIDVFMDMDYTKEEWKWSRKLRKLCTMNQ